MQKAGAEHFALEQVDPQLLLIGKGVNIQLPLRRRLAPENPLHDTGDGHPGTTALLQGFSIGLG